MCLEFLVVDNTNRKNSNVDGTRHFAPRRRGCSPASMAGADVEPTNVGGGTERKAKGEGGGGEESALLQLPITRIRKIMFEEEAVRSVSPEACFVVARATEIFLTEITQRSAALMGSQDNTLQYDHVADVMANWKATEFLSDIVPKRVLARDLP